MQIVLRTGVCAAILVIWFVIWFQLGISYSALSHRLEHKTFADARAAHILGYVTFCVFLVWSVPAVLVLFLVMPVSSLAARLRRYLHPPSPLRLEPLPLPELMPITPFRTRGALANGAPTPDSSHDGGRPLLRVLGTSIASHRRTLLVTIKFVFANSCGARELVLADVHACIHERQFARRLPMMIGYQGRLPLLEGNTVRKDARRRYSFAAGDGGEYDLTLRLTEGDGMSRTVFGILVHYYFGAERALPDETIPSDCIWLVTSQSSLNLGIGQTRGSVRIAAIDDDAIAGLRSRWARRADYLDYIGQLAEVLGEHRQRVCLPSLGR